jgi:hypothetical protein
LGVTEITNKQQLAMAPVVVVAQALLPVRILQSPFDREVRAFELQNRTARVAAILNATGKR